MMEITRGQFEELCRSACAIRAAATRHDTPLAIQQILLNNAGRLSGILAECYVADMDADRIPGLRVIDGGSRL